jgi:hypothetical protein
MTHFGQRPAEELFDRLWTNTDDLDRKVVKGVLGGTYTWLEEGVIDPSEDGAWIADATPGPAKRFYLPASTPWKKSSSSRRSSR